MAPKIAAKQVHGKRQHMTEPEEEDINRPPESYDSSSDDGNNRADIKNTWGKSEEQKFEKASSTAGSKGTVAVNEKSVKNRRSTRSSKENTSPSSSNSTTSSTGSQKRKTLGTDNRDGIFGRSGLGNKKAKQTYSRSNPTSSARTASSQIKGSQSSSLSTMTYSFHIYINLYRCRGSSPIQTGGCY
jgi:hypothetical protein